METLHAKQLKKYFRPDEWQFEFQQREDHPMFMADLWCRALHGAFREELGLLVSPPDYLFTASSRGYIKRKHKVLILRKLRTALQREAYRRYIYTATLRRMREFREFASEVRQAITTASGRSSASLRRFWERHDALFLKVVPWFYIPWYISEENMLTDTIRDGVVKHKTLIGKIADPTTALMTLTTPTEPLAFQQERRAFFRLVRFAEHDSSTLRTPAFRRQATVYLSRFAWMKTFAFLPIEPLIMRELQERVRRAVRDYSLDEHEVQEKKRRQQRIAKKLEHVLRRDRKLMNDIRWAQKLGWLLTVSVEQALESVAKLQPFYRIFAQRIGVRYQDWIHLTFSEIHSTLRGNEPVDRAELRRRRRGFVYLMEDGKPVVVVGEEGRALTTWVDEVVGERAEAAVSEIHGTPASPGRALGRVHVAPRARDSNALRKGEILVCSMTSPEYIPAMQRAAAIVTDEGGLLSHAAIVSRELGKPCVIATKVATKVLKDGDMVEVDATRGVVKMLKKR